MLLNKINMAHLTLSLHHDFEGLQPYSNILPKSKEFSDLQDALKFCQENNMVFACYITQWSDASDEADIEYQCSMDGVEVETEAGEYYHDLDWV